MLLIFTTFLFLLAGVSLAILIKKLVTPVLLEEGKKVRQLEAENYRSLFAPTKEDLRLAEKEEQTRSAFERAEEERRLLQQKRAELDKIRARWSASPDRSATIDLLYSASQTGDGNSYLAVCEDVLAAWRAERLTAIDADDLAQLLESHLWLLPADQRTPGITFRLRDDIADLRRSGSKQETRVRKS